jgi:tRNA threonylcarbamoyladenosine biosynthesis protein TsaB
MNVLAIETATEACSAALFLDGRTTSRFVVGEQRHTHLILPMCDELIREAGIALSALDAVAFGRGPGSFTGVRISAGVAQGIAFAHDLPVVPVSTLAVLAQEAMTELEQSNILVALDARMNEVYWGIYQRDERGLAQCMVEECVIAPHRINLPTRGGWYGVGSGWRVYAHELTQRVGNSLSAADGNALPKAKFMIPLALNACAGHQVVSAEQALPVYLRDWVARKKTRDRGE